MVKEIEKIMRTRNIYILSVCLAAALSCTEFQEETLESADVDIVEMTFTANICDESDSETKTVLDGQLGDNLRKVLWTPEDEIGIFAKGYTESSHPFKFVNNATSNSETAEFIGGANLASEYFAIYPYDQSNLVWFNTEYPDGYHYSILFEIPQTQKYVEGSFDKNTAPMVAKAAYGEPLQFKNLCGILALNLTGEEKVKSISFSGKNTEGTNMYVSGDFQIIMDYEEDPVIIAGPDGPTGEALLEHTYKSVSLVCDEPVQLSETEATPFYFVLPPATYETFTLLITTEDGKIMMKEGTKPLTIRRSDVQPTADLAYAETVSINLSENGIANSYIVPQAGVYSFQANVIGNGELGLINGADFHTSDVNITPASAELLWCEHEGAVSGVSFDESNGRISFLATGQEGNAVIAAKDADGNIIWSWHIWMTDQPAELLYKNTTGEYTVLDRNLGATRATSSTDDKEWQETKGLAYQWGRKDPFVKHRFYQGMYNPSATYTTSTDQIDIETSIANPSTFYGVDHSLWTNSSNPSLWLTDKKTIYDPCPAGYRVANNDIWKGFTKTGSSLWGEFDQYNIESVDRKGWYFLYDGSHSTYYPSTWFIGIDGNSMDESYVTMWSSTSYNSTRSNAFRAYYYTESDSHVYPVDHYEDKTVGHMVRCMKDNVKSDLLIKITGITNTTSTSAQVNARIITYNGAAVSETGFVVGTSPEVCIADGKVVPTGKRTGDVSAQINGLTESTKYYIKAYVILGNGITEYSQPKTFGTTSANGTYLFYEPANSFIVNPNNGGTYSFEIKEGNSETLLTNASYAEILWETYNTNEIVTENSVIASVQLEGNKVKFNMPANPVPGNAVIAVMDSNGTILWSWHIWVADFDIEATAQNYGNGIIMMDRNLGALNIADNDSRSYGLMYQWGRKDPFVAPVSENNFAQTTPANTLSSVDNIADYNYSIQNPRVALRGSWNNNNNLWDNEKTIYDPCPAGWRVPDGSNNSPWASISEMGWNGYGTLVYFDTIDSDMAYYPTGGYADSNFAIMQFGTEASMYTCDVLDTNIAYTFYYVNWGWAYSGSTSKEDFKYVRCQKDE